MMNNNKLAENDGMLLTSAQLDIYLDQKRYPSSPIYNIGGRMKIRESVCVPSFHRAMEQLVAENDVFHLYFTDAVERPVQYRTEVPCKFEFLDFSDELDAEEKAQLFVKKQLNQPFNLAEAGLYRSFLLKLADQVYWYIPVAHHLITDGFGYSNWFDTLFRYYLSNVRKQSDPQVIELTQFDSVVEYINQSTDTSEQATTYWQQKFSRPLPDRVFIPKKINQPIKHESFLSQHAISQTDYSKLCALAKSMGVRVHHLFMSAVVCYLNLQYQTSDIVLALPFHNRDKVTARAIGGIVSVLPMRFNVDQQWSMAELAAEIRTQMRDVTKYKRYPVSKIVEHARQVKPDLERLFDVQFNYQKLDYKLADGLINAESEFIPPGVETTPLLFNLCEFGDHQDVILQVEANKALFEQSDIALMFERIFTIISGMRDNPNQKISEFNFFNEEDYQAYKLLNNRAEDCEINSLVLRFNEQVLKDPTRIALQVGELVFTYQDLSILASQVTTVLSSNNVKRGDRVGLCLERNENMVATLLACLSMGVTYIPLDPSYPLERLAFMFSDSQAAMLVTDSQSAQAVNLNAKQTLLIDHHISLTATSVVHPLEVPTDRALLGAYILYTSGSTGRPKGTLIAQHSLDNLICSMAHRLDLNNKSDCLATTTIGFDISTLEIYGPLIVGGKVTLVDQQVGKDALKLAAYADARKYNLFQCTPTMWQALVEAGWQGNDEVTLVTVGEPLYPALAEQMMARSLRVVNAYGPTEATVYSMVEVVHRDKTGVPSCRLAWSLPNYRHFVVDNREQLSPIGVTGELCIAGDGLALEYIGRPDITEAQFVSLPAVASERIYRTGDLVTLNRQGEIEYLGRIDHQVKIRGYRIELGEIEEKLVQLSGIKLAVVTTLGNQSSDVKLAAYVIMEPGITLDIAAVRAELAADLPNFMLPHFYTEMDAFPLTSSGKVDRKVLPAPRERKVECVVASTNTERLLCDVWQSLFELDKVSITHNFFELGGHSLLAMKMFGQLRKEIQVDLPLASIFELPTIAQLAAKIDVLLEERSFNSTTRHLIQSDIERGHPLSRSQLSMWLIDKLSYGTAQYNMPGVFSITGALQITALQNALAQLVGRHEVLRTVLIDDAITAKQYVLEDYSLDVPVVDLSAKHDVMSCVESFIDAEANMPFQLNAGLKIRAKIIKTAPEHHFLLLTLHHIAADGWSINILTQELEALYRSTLKNEAAELPTLDIQYKDYAHWQHQNIQDGLLDEQVTYWLDFLADHPQVHSLPLDFPRPPERSSEGRSYKFDIENRLYKDLTAFCQRKSMTPFMVLQLVYALLVSEQSGESDILIGTPVAGRNHPDIEKLIGCFTNSIVLRNQIDLSRSVDELLTETKHSVMSAFDNQEVPFELLVERLNPTRNKGYNPIFQLWFVYHSQQFNPMKLDGLQVKMVEAHSPSVKFDLSLSVFEKGDTLTLDWEYLPELFTEGTIAKYATCFKSILQWLLTEPDTLFPSLSDALPSIDEPVVASGVFAAQVLANVTACPEAVVMVDDGAKVEQQALLSKVKHMRAYLNEQGVESGTTIGISLEHSEVLLVTQLACLFSNITFVEFDPADKPDEIIKRFNLKFTVTHGQLSAALMGTSLTLLDATDAWGCQVPIGLNDCDPAVPTQTVCIINPATDKEIALTQQDLLILSSKLAAELGVYKGGESRFMWSTSKSFDGSATGLCLMSLGFELHIVDDNTLSSNSKFNEYISSHRISLIELAAGGFNLLDSQQALRFDDKTNFLINSHEMNSHLVDVLVQHQAHFNAKVIAVNTLIEDLRRPVLELPLSQKQQISMSKEMQSRMTQLRSRIAGVLHSIYASLLKKEHINVNTGFFELGGSPLQINGLSSYCEQHFKTELSKSVLEKGPSISQLAELISSIFINQSVASTNMTATTSAHNVRK
ncbi:non-ribosomal peptide synthetase [Pseudoalteromonas aurantia]|uniref:Non-ribosomal peptide synthetase n=2 Tax=Pseudoalteromonas aurantia TaxID=43654 RepID=A0A5S3VF16_9GAMM|nr:non-ribosomal peptide synthetase [Pseudoalteromonas aurantia]